MDTYPPTGDIARLSQYNLNEKIFLGEHFDAFNVISQDFKKDYSALRYLACNFGGLISKLSADMLFEEFPQIILGENGDTEFMQAFFQQNRLKPQIYESGLEQSYSGDVIFRLRAQDSQLICEDINPSFYFPELDPMNVRAEPKAHVLAWKVTLAGKDREAVFMEKHYKGSIVNELWELDKGELAIKLNVGEYMKNADGTPLQDVIETGVDDFLIVHIPNFRMRSRYYGISDYKDLISLMFAVNNRMTKIDNILDKHGDPILAVPDGVLDDDGKVRKGSFGVIEVDSTESNGSMPQYIVWDAKLESAFSEIDRLVDFLMLFGDASKSMFGMDKQGAAESGRALKYRMLRTIAKKHRKQLYYDVGLHDLFFTAQKFAKANQLSCGNISLKKDVVPPTIKWQDGIINDPVEQLDIEERKVDDGFSTHAESIAVLDNISEKEAQEKYKRIQKEKEENAPKFTAKPVIPNGMGGKGGAGDQK